MKIILLLIVAAVLAACAPQAAQPLCNREAIAWDKWGEPTELSAECLPAAPVVYAAIPPGGGTPEKPQCRSCPPYEPPSTERVHRDNGLGNLDDPAPGRSLTRNRAENEAGNPGHNSGKAQNSD